jgi:chromosome segregation ATPase
MLFSPRKLTLSNFKAIRGVLEYEFETAPGLYFVAGRNEVQPRMGPNGVAKSTVFVDAMSWALQGQTSRAKSPGSDVENWSVDKGSVGVAFEFQIGDRCHTVERRRRPNKLLLDGEPCTQEEIDKLLPLSDSALRRTLLIGQFATMFLDLRPEDKSRIFSETLGLDVWLGASDSAGRKLSDAQRSVAKAREDLAGFEASLAEVHDQFEQAKTRKGEFEEQRSVKLANLRREKSKLLADMHETADNLDRVKGSGAAASRRELRRKLVPLQQRERELVADVAQLKAAADSAEVARRQMDSQLSKYRSDSKTCPECGQNVTEQHIVDKRRELEQHLREHDEAYVKVQARRRTLESEALPAAKKAVDEATEELAEVEISYAELEKWEMLDQLQQTNLSSWNERIEEVQTEANPFTSSIERLGDRIDSLRESRTRVKTEIADLEKSTDVYQFWQQGFREIRLEQIDSTLIELEIAANRHAEELGLEDWELQFSTERETARGSISHKFNVTLFPPDQDKPVSWESYCGGESQRLQLGTTFGLAEVLLSRAGIQTDIEVLDEPTHHLSAEGIDDLLSCLKDRAIEHGRRIYVIDHHMLDKGAFDGTITVVKDKQGVRLE